MRLKTFRVCVHHLDGELNIELGRNRKGGDLFDTVCHRLGILEDWYFGIQYEDTKGCPRWIKTRKKLYSQIRGGRRPVSFLVRYFPDDMALVSDPATRQLLYEHCKREILGGSVECSPEMCILLASYAVQADYGNWDEVDYRELAMESLVPKGARVKYAMRPQLWADSVRIWHKDHEGMTSDRARFEYVRVAQNTTNFGVHYFPVRWSSEPKWLGVTPQGIRIYDESDRNVPRIGLRWIFIATLRFTRKKFVVRPVFKRIPDYVFYSSSGRTTKEIFLLCVGYHKIYARSLPRRSQLYGETDKTEVELPLYEDIDSGKDNCNRLTDKNRCSSNSMKKLPTLLEEREL